MKRGWNRPRFDLVELVLVAAAASFVTLLAVQQLAPRLCRERASPYVITLTREERRVLESRARKYTLPYFQVVGRS